MVPSHEVGQRLVYCDRFYRDIIENVKEDDKVTFDGEEHTALIFWQFWVRNIKWRHCFVLIFVNLL